MTGGRVRRPGTNGRRALRLVRALSGTAVVAAVLGTALGGSAANAASPSTGPLPASPAAHRAVTPAKDVAVIVLDTVTPTVVRTGTDVTITGTVTAPLIGPLSGPTLRVVRGDVVDQRQQLDDWADGRTKASGPVVGTSTLPTVAAGQTRTFTATVPWQGLASPKPFAAIPIAVEVVQQGASEPTGATRTFVAWNDRKEYVPLKVATALPLTLDPDVDLFSRDDAARHLAWQRAIGADSRVARILDGTRGSPVDLAVDPALLGPAPAPATSAPTPTPASTTGAPPSGTGSPPATSGTAGATTGAPTDQPTDQTPAPPSSATSAIERLGADIVTQLRGRSVWALPYADADIAATVGADPANSLVRDLVSRASTLAARLDQPARSDIVWPVDGLMPAGREAGIRILMSGTTTKKAAGIVVNAAAVTRASPYIPTARRVTPSGTRLLAYDPRLSALLPTRSEPSPVLSVQRYLAESLVLLGERAGTPRSVLVVGQRTYDPDGGDLATFLAATSRVPWIEPVDAASLLTDNGADRAVPVATPLTAVPSAAPPAVLNSRRLRQMAEQRSNLISVSSVLRDGEEFARTYLEVLDELASTRWRYKPGSWATLATSIAADVRAATSAIKVVSRSVNLLAENGTLQVTIENGLDYAVEDLRLRLVPNTPRIQIVEQPGPVTIGPSSRTNVLVPVAAVAAGRAEIRAYLTTADGALIGSPATIRVSANPLDAAIYWVGGTLVGLVLLLGVARAVLRGTSRVDEIADIEAVTAAHQGVGDTDDGDRG